MLGLTMKETDELIPIHDDPTVRSTTERLTAARRKLERLEADERGLIRLVTGREDVFSDEELAEARCQLAIHKGTQTGWYLPEAETAREEVRRAEAAYQEAVAPARERLIQAATSKIASLTKQLADSLPPAQKLALEIERVRQEMSDGGARPCEHSCPALLPDGIVNFHLRNAKARGWI